MMPSLSTILSVIVCAARRQALYRRLDALVQNSFFGQDASHIRTRIVIFIFSEVSLSSVFAISVFLRFRFLHNSRAFTRHPSVLLHFP